MGGKAPLLALILAGLLLAPLAAQALDGSGATGMKRPGAMDPAGPVLPPAAEPIPWWTGSARFSSAPLVDAAILRLEAEGIAAAFAPSGMPRYAVTQGPAGLLYNVFLRFETEPGLDQWRDVARLAPGETALYPLAEAVYVRGVDFPGILGLIAVPGAVAVELERAVVPFLDIAAPSAMVVPHESFGPWGARERWKVQGRGAVVAVLDTGIDKEHEVFDPQRYVGGYDATVPTGRVGEELLGGMVPTWTPLNERDPHDDYYRDAQSFAHGTHMASIAFGDDPNGTYTGMAPAARFLDVKVISNVTAGAGLPGGAGGLPYGWGSYVLEGLEFVHRYNKGESHLGDPGRDKVAVALLALGETEPDLDGTGVLSHAVDRLVGSGVIVVAAAGNCGPSGNPDCAGRNNTIVAPGAAERAITVGSMMHNGTVDFTDEALSAFSSRGPNGGEPKPNLVAFGEPIRAARGEPDPVVQATNGYRNGTGTSQAAAQVAGIVALMLEVDPGLTPHRAKEILMATSRQPGDQPAYLDLDRVHTLGWDEALGAGVVDALFAVGVAFGAWRPDGSDAGEHERPTPPPDEEEEEPRRVNQAPVVRFHHRPGSPVAGESVVFIDRSMDPDGDDLVAFRWDFGDGTTGNGARAAHIYQKEGDYRVVLTVTDVHGTAGSWHDTVRVQAAQDVKESPMGGLVWLALAACLAALAHARGKKGVP